MAETSEQDRCAQCGREFRCGMHGLHPCWCATGFAPLAQADPNLPGCLCPECLARRLAAARGAIT
ncbi:MAG TPA: cysteine-rich CWC family protein [Burkholderiales bacterium]|nr:cysteine-rich CWC family protein [Burkholderiales bacterium]